MLVIAAGGTPAAFAVEIGTARVNVLQELGPPASAIARGETEVFTYKNGVRIKLKNGRVTEMTGLTPAPAPAAAEAEVAAPATAPEAAPAKAATDEMAALEKEQADMAAAARLKMEKAIEDMEGTANRPAPPPPGFDVMKFVFQLGLKWLLTLAALKLAAKYWNSDVPWTGVLLVSFVDVAVRGIVGYIGFELLHFMTLFYADEAIAAPVMVMLLRKVSTNQRLTLAIEVTMTVKTFTIVVGSFLVTVLLRLLN